MIGLHLISIILIPLLLIRRETQGKLYYYENGNVTLSCVLNIHMHGNEIDGCSHLNHQVGFMYAAAFSFAIKRINQNKSFLFNHTLGHSTHDTCGNARILRNQLVTIARGGAVGVVGAQYSDDAIATTVVMDIFGRALISPLASADELSDSMKYRNFFRTIAPDYHMSQVMIDLAVFYNWSYVTVVNSRDSYGDRASFAFSLKALHVNVCISKKITIDTDVADKFYIKTLEQLISVNSAKVVFLFLKDVTLRKLFSFAHLYVEGLSKLTFIVGNGWGARRGVVNNIERFLTGALTIQPRADIVPEFENYYKSISPDRVPDNRWLNEMWQEIFKCRPINKTFVNLSLPLCNGTEMFGVGNGYYPQTNVLSIINAVYAFAHVIRKMILDFCSLPYEKCNIKKVINEKYRFLQIYTRLRAVEFDEPFRKKKFYFNEYGSASENYEIFSFRKNDSNQEYYFKKVGVWNDYQNVYASLGNMRHYLRHEPYKKENLTDFLKMEGNEIVWDTNGNDSIPVSLCSSECRQNEIKKYSTQNACCWSCKQCGDNHIVLNNKCIDCGLMKVPNVEQSECLQLRIVGSDSNTISYVFYLAASIGSMLTLFVIILLIRYFEMRLVKSWGRDLCMILLSGILIMYISSLLFVIRPTLVICGIQRVMFGFSFALTYSPLLLKVTRIYRIFQSGKATPLRPSFVRPMSQIVLALAISSVQLLLGAIWLAGQSPQLEHRYPSHRKYVILQCKTSHYNTALNFLYSGILMLITTWFAFQTRNLPKHYNEARNIGITMYVTCFSIAGLLPIYFFVDGKYEFTGSYIMSSMCILTATFALVGLFFNKVKLILIPGSVVHEKRGKNAAPTLSTLSIIRGSCATPSAVMKSKPESSN